MAQRIALGLISLTIMAASMGFAPSKALADAKVPEQAKAQADLTAKLAEAKRLLQNGRYAEAEEAYTTIEKEAQAIPGTRVTIGLGRADARASQGEYGKAIKELEVLASLADLPAAGRPDVLARLAELLLDRGRWEEAAARAKQALASNPDHLLGRWVEVRLLDLRGELDKAVAAWKWFVDRYNEKQAELAKSAESLLLVGQAAERYYRATARGEELSGSLNDVINEIYEGALRADPNCWQAPWLEGRLFLSGYNERSATQGAGPGPADQPAGARDLGDAGPGRPARVQLAAGRIQGRTGPCDQPPLCARAMCCWPT